MFGETPLHEFPNSYRRYSQTEWNFILAHFGARETKNDQRTLLYALWQKWPLKSLNLNFTLKFFCTSTYSLTEIVSGVPRGRVLGPLLYLLYTSELFSILENKLIGYADDSTLMAVVPSPGARVAAAESRNRDLVRVNAWCDLLRDEIECE